MTNRLIAEAAADVGPERLAPPVRKVLRVIQVVDRRQLFLAGGVAQPHRGVWIDRPQRQVLGHAFDEPQGKALGAVLSGRRVRVCGDVELEGVHELVSDDVVGIGEGTAERQHDAPPHRLSHAAGAFTHLSGDDVVLFEVGVRRVQHQRLASAKLMLEDPLEAGEPPFGKPGRNVDALTLARIEVDVEMLGLEDLEIQVLVLDLVLSEVLGRNRRAESNHEDGDRDY